MVATLARRRALALTSLARDIPFSAGSFQEALGVQKLGQCCVHAFPWHPPPFYLGVEKGFWQPFSCFLPVWRERGALYICRGEIREWGTSSARDLIKGELAGDPIAAQKCLGLHPPQTERAG